MRNTEIISFQPDVEDASRELQLLSDELLWVGVERIEDEEEPFGLRGRQDGASGLDGVVKPESENLSNRFEPDSVKALNVLMICHNTWMSA